MPRSQVPFYSLNAGEVDPDALGRIDLEKLRIAGESVVNFTPTVLGGLHMRPGTKFVGETISGNAATLLIPHIYNSSKVSLIEISSQAIRVRNSDALVTFEDYSTTINNPYFTSAIVTNVDSGWINASSNKQNRATTVSTTAGGRLLLSSTKYSFAIARQRVTVASADRQKLHTLKIIVLKGPITFRVGTVSGKNDVVSDQRLDNGTHFITFKPNNASVVIELEANDSGHCDKRVDECSFVKNKIMELPSPYTNANLKDIRYAQSGSVIFIACRGVPPYMIERRGDNSWGLVEYRTINGPYMPYSGRKVRLKVSRSIGNPTTMESDQPFFNEKMVGSLFEITTDGQRRTVIFTDKNQASEPIRVSGRGGMEGRARRYTFTTTYSSAFTDTSTGSSVSVPAASGNIQVQFSYGQPDAWVNGYGEQTAGGITPVTTSGTFVVNDARLKSNTSPAYTLESNDNSVVYHRLLRTSGNTNGTIAATMDYAGGAQTGVVRLYEVIDSKTATVEVLKEIGAADTFTDDWREGAWSANQSWPTAVAIHDGRLWWGGLDKVYGSVSDDYFNFDPRIEGDSGPIIRSIATGPVENISWILGLQRLVVGTASAEASIRSSSFDEPLTPSQFTVRNASTMGCASIQALQLDSTGIFVQKNLFKIYEFLYDVNVNDYTSRDLTRLNKFVCKPGVIDMAGQRQPDTRVWFVKRDGSMAMLLYERQDDVVGWSRFETDGEIESVCTLPSNGSSPNVSSRDDDVYLVVKRVITINGQATEKRYIEKLTSSSETEDGDGSYLVDCSVKYTPDVSSTKTVPGLQHLRGKQVVAKNGSSDPGKLYTVSNNGTITLDNFIGTGQSIKSVVVGLPYTAKFKSVKLAYGSAQGTALGQKKRVDHLGIVANNTAPEGVSIGRNFSDMTKLSSLIRGKPLSDGQIIEHYDYDATSFGGAWDTDSRVCIKCASPYSAHIIGLVIKMNTNDKAYAWQRRQSDTTPDEA
jgi:hypothetical protein